MGSFEETLLLHFVKGHIQGIRSGIISFALLKSALLQSIRVDIPDKGATHNRQPGLTPVTPSTEMVAASTPPFHYLKLFDHSRLIGADKTLSAQTLSLIKHSSSWVYLHSRWTQISHA
jgi:hypothetical protein